jgi:hypothetical protein
VLPGGYSIELWAELLADFTAEFVGPDSAPQGAVLVGNSIGSLVCLTVRMQDFPFCFLLSGADGDLRPACLSAARVCWHKRGVQLHAPARGTLGGFRSGCQVLGRC